MSAPLRPRALALSLKQLTEGDKNMNEVEGESRQVQGGLTDEQKRENVIQLVFGGRPERFEEFCGLLRNAVPDGTAVVLRGSAVTGMLSSITRGTARGFRGMHSSRLSPPGPASDCSVST